MDSDDDIHHTYQLSVWNSQEEWKAESGKLMMPGWYRYCCGTKNCRSVAPTLSFSRAETAHALSWAPHQPAINTRSIVAFFFHCLFAFLFFEQVSWANSVATLLNSTLATCQTSTTEVSTKRIATSSMHTKPTNRTDISHCRPWLKRLTKKRIPKTK